MNKTTKGALSAGTAAVLLLGGAGSLAYWNGTATLNGGSINSGYLSLTNPSCTGVWKYATTGQPTSGTTVNFFVPGDVVTTTCQYTINAKGDNLSATLTTPTVSFGTATSLSGATLTPAANLTIKPTAVYTIAGRTPAQTQAPLTPDGSFTITSADDTKLVTAVITAQIPFGAGATSTANGNDTQNIKAALNTINVVATQTTSAANPAA